MTSSEKKARYSSYNITIFADNFVPDPFYNTQPVEFLSERKTWLLNQAVLSLYPLFLPVFLLSFISVLIRRTHSFCAVFFSFFCVPSKLPLVPPHYRKLYLECTLCRRNKIAKSLLMHCGIATLWSHCRLVMGWDRSFDFKL